MRASWRLIGASCCCVALMSIAGVSLAEQKKGAEAKSEERKMSKEEVQACDKKFAINVKGDTPMHSWSAPTAPKSCSIQTKDGFPVPDPKCTPGAINPSMKLETLKDPEFKTGCVRDQATSAEMKKKTYAWYGVTEPKPNEGENQVCELDHFISLELGGADTLDNLWPQCGPDNTVLRDRYFKQKDIVENYLAHLVKHDRMSLSDAQKGISTDWTQYLKDARELCPDGKCPAE